MVVFDWHLKTWFSYYHFWLEIFKISKKTLKATSAPFYLLKSGH